MRMGGRPALRRKVRRERTEETDGSFQGRARRTGFRTSLHLPRPVRKPEAQNGIEVGTSVLHASARFAYRLRRRQTIRLASTPTASSMSVPGSGTVEMPAGVRAGTARAGLASAVPAAATGKARCRRCPLRRRSPESPRLRRQSPGCWSATRRCRPTPAPADTLVSPL